MKKGGFHVRVGYCGWMSKGKGMIGESVRWGKGEKGINKLFILYTSKRLYWLSKCFSCRVVYNCERKG